MLAVVNRHIAPMYKYARFGTCIDEVLYGMPVNVIKTEGEFSFIKTHYFYKGFVKTSALYFISKGNNIHNNMYENFFSTKNSLLCKESKTNKKQSNILAKYCVITPFADVLSVPDVKGLLMQSIPRGGVVAAYTRKDNFWQKVILVNGKTGYTKANNLKVMPLEVKNTKFINKTKEQKLRNNICKTALLYLGAQYRWGGKTPLGIDCSGLVSMAYMLNGVTIYRDSKINSDFLTKKIKIEHIKKADILYFPGHVAMYLGCDKFVHSTAFENNNGVRINSFNNTLQNYRRDLHENIYGAASIFNN